MCLTLTVHRGATEIGGSCIEITCLGARLVLDAGRPLDAPETATGLLPATLDRTQPATVLFSHAHQDHWGLIDELPETWELWAGQDAAKLIELTCEVRQKPLAHPILTWDSRSAPFNVGPFRVTPFLTDHSAFDAYMLLIEADGRRVLYSGDFRKHGRKGVLVDRMIARLPGGIDVLILEGTNLGTDKPCQTEMDLEAEFLALFCGVPGRVFVSWSGQNIDRTVTLYRAAKRAGRRLVLDLYTADVMERIGDGTGLPRIGAGFGALSVAITAGLRKVYSDRKGEAWIGRMAAEGTAARDLRLNDVVMLRDSLVRDYDRAGIRPGREDAFVWSMWKGYLERGSAARDWCAAGGARTECLHTSGHASPADLRVFAKAIAAKTVIPVHGTNWNNDHGIAGLHPLPNGLPMRIA